MILSMPLVTSTFNATFGIVFGDGAGVILSALTWVEWGETAVATGVDSCSISSLSTLATPRHYAAQVEQDERLGNKIKELYVRWWQKNNHIYTNK